MSGPPIATTFIPIAPAEIASTSAILPATMNAPVAIAPVVQATASSIQITLATTLATKSVATVTTTATFGQITPQNVVVTGKSKMSTSECTEGLLEKNLFQLATLEVHII